MGSKVFKIEYDPVEGKYYLTVFGFTALNEPGWLLVGTAQRKDVLYEKAKAHIKLAEKDEIFMFSPDYDVIPTENPFKKD